MNAAAWYNRGVEHTRAGEYRQAVGAFKSAIDLDPGFVRAWHGKGVVFSHLGQLQKALWAFDKVLHFDLRHVGAWNGKGNVLRELGQPEEALEAFDEALKSDPELASALNGRGAALRDLGRLEEALEAFDEALKFNSELAPVWNGRGTVLAVMNRLEEALQAYDRVIELDTEYIHAWNGKGNVLSNLGRLEEALQAYGRVIELEPEYAYAWGGKGNVLRKMGRPKEALRAYNMALYFDQEYAYAWNGKGNVLRELGQPEEALEAFDDALKLKPQYLEPWLNRGYLLRDVLKCPGAAQRSVLRALHLANPPARLETGRLAIKEVASILDHLQDTGGAPLLIISTVERHSLTDIYLRKPPAISQAYEQSIPYQILRDYFDSSAESESENLRKHSLLGLAAFYLGDPFLAQEHFGVVEDLSDLFGPFYYGRTYQEYARDEFADLIFEDSFEAAERVLQRADYPEANHSEEANPRELYYAGQLFIAGSVPRWEKARACFEHSADHGFLPAKYMLALALKERDKEDGAAHEKALVSILEEEKTRLSAYEVQGSEPGYLGGAQLSDFSTAQGKGASADPSGSVEDLEQFIWHCAHAAEISEAILHVYDWLEEEEKEHGQIPPEYSFVDRYERAETLRLWALREDQINLLQERFGEKRRSVDLQQLRISLGRFTDIPSLWLETGPPQTSKDKQEALLGERIRRDRGEERSELYQELITYLALRGRISARATLSLTAYVLATTPVSTAERRNSILEKTGEATITTAVAESLPLAGLSLSAFTSVFTTFSASLVAALVIELAKDWRSKKVDYPTFRKKFDAKLEAQSEEVFEHVLTMLEAIEERQQEEL
jgi:tetratricopeptide (TPR) repeat protein